MPQAVALLPYYTDPCHAHVASVYAAGLIQIPLFGCACIDQARNILATEAPGVAPTADVFVFIDGDISFEPVDFARVCDAARRTRGIVGNCYSSRRLGDKLIGQPANLPLKEPILAYDDGRLYEATALGMGFTAIHRDALAKVCHSMQPVIMSFSGRPAYPIFMPLIDGGTYHAEDHAFCIRARALGIPLHVDTRGRLKHHGQHAFRLEDLGMDPTDRARLVIHQRSRPNTEHLLENRPGEGDNAAPAA